jgi:hypothetical protein
MMPSARLGKSTPFWPLDGGLALLLMMLIPPPPVL